MFFFLHLLTGIVLGLLVADFLHDRRWVLPIAIGSVLPDLIDKPIGNLLFADIFGNGRIFMHSLFIFCIFLLIGIVIWKRWAHPGLMALALGLFSHQVLDLMWEDPKAWYFPLFGPFRYVQGGDFAFLLLQRDISIHSEWILAIAMVVAFILFLAFRQYGFLISRYQTVSAWLIGAGAVVFFLLSGATFVTGLVSATRTTAIFFRFFGWVEPVECIIGGIVFLLCAVLLWRMRSNLLKNGTIIFAP